MKQTSEQMQLVINEWQTSGLSKKAFCREKNIKYQNFHYWYKRLLSTSAQGFTEIVVEAGERNSGCEVIFPSGTRMLLRGEPSTAWLRELLR